ncbi:MAG: hypothetical protein AAF432_08345 [Planctomycetota bacterium]
MTATLRSDDPLFIDLLGPDGIPGTGDEDLTLHSDSPYVNFGVDVERADDEQRDAQQRPRVQQCSIDLGGLESDAIGPDCNQNGLSDACEAQEPDEDCNGNGLPDSCDADSGVMEDCDRNGVPDACDILNDPALDCDNNMALDCCEIEDVPGLDCSGNGVLDRCEFSSEAVIPSAFAPIPFFEDVDYEFELPFAVDSDVTITVRAVANLESTFSRIFVRVQGQNMFTAFTENEDWSNCNGDVPAVTSGVVPFEVWNDLVLGNQAVVTLFSAADSCSSLTNIAAVELSYLTIDGFADFNGNGIADECECMADIAPPGGNGEVNVDDLLEVIIGFGFCSFPPCSSDVNQNLVTDIDDVLQVILEFGPCESD